MSSDKITIIIVNYNSTEYLIKLIKSLTLIRKIVEKIIIVDNNSNDFNQSLVFKVAKHTKTNIILNNTNKGFSYAVNQGIKISTSNFILLLNPDTTVVDKSIEKLLKKIINNTKIGVIGGAIESMSSKTRQLTANTRPTFLTALFEFTNLKRLFPNNKFSNRFWVEKKPNNHNRTEEVEVDGLCGAFMLFRKNLIPGGTNFFDENFFLYLEDLDFCLGVKNKGLSIIFDPSSKIRHKSGASSNSKYNIVLKHWYQSRKYFFCKHLNPIQGIILKVIFSIEESILSLYHHIRHEPAE